METISCGDRVKNEELLQELGEKTHLAYKKNEGKVTGFGTSCVGPAFEKERLKRLLKERYQER